MVRPGKQSILFFWKESKLLNWFLSQFLPRVSTQLTPPPTPKSHFRNSSETGGVSCFKIFTQTHMENGTHCCADLRFPFSWSLEHRCSFCFKGMEHSRTLLRCRFLVLIVLCVYCVNFLTTVSHLARVSLLCLGFMEQKSNGVNDSCLCASIKKFLFYSSAFHPVNQPATQNAYFWGEHSEKPCHCCRGELVCFLAAWL